jgi:hypothetical protein
LLEVALQPERAIGVFEAAGFAQPVEAALEPGAVAGLVTGADPVFGTLLAVAALVVPLATKAAEAAKRALDALLRIAAVGVLLTAPLLADSRLPFAEEVGAARVRVYPAAALADHLLKELVLAADEGLRAVIVSLAGGRKTQSLDVVIVIYEVSAGGALSAFGIVAAPGEALIDVCVAVGAMRAVVVVPASRFAGSRVCIAVLVPAAGQNAAAARADAVAVLEAAALPIPFAASRYAAGVHAGEAVVEAAAVKVVFAGIVATARVRIAKESRAAVLVPVAGLGALSDAAGLAPWAVVVRLATAAKHCAQTRLSVGALLVLAAPHTAYVVEPAVKADLFRAAIGVLLAEVQLAQAVLSVADGAVGAIVRVHPAPSEAGVDVQLGVEAAKGELLAIGVGVARRWLAQAYRLVLVVPSVHARLTDGAFVITSAADEALLPLGVAEESLGAVLVADAALRTFPRIDVTVLFEPAIELAATFLTRRWVLVGVAEVGEGTIEVACTSNAPALAKEGVALETIEEASAVAVMAATFDAGLGGGLAHQKRRTIYVAGAWPDAGSTTADEAF